jgi:hypothetical protein|tara:strand:+ start:4783 stop:5019 length:237 start_codon:yes stop_codon:yes gene_type:complete
MSEVFKPGIKKYSMPKTMNMHNRDQNNMTISRGSGKAQSKTTSGGDRMFKIGYRRTENPGLSMQDSVDKMIAAAVKGV